eukprot:s1809_g5.t1
MSASQAKATNALRLSAATRRLLAELPPPSPASNLSNTAGSGAATSGEEEVNLDGLGGTLLPFQAGCAIRACTMSWQMLDTLPTIDMLRLPEPQDSSNFGAPRKNSGEDCSLLVTGVLGETYFLGILGPYVLGPANSIETLSYGGKSCWGIFLSRTETGFWDDDPC